MSIRFPATRIALASSLLIVTCCQTPAPPPPASGSPPIARPEPASTQPPAPAPVPASTAWIDQPRTPGNWVYEDDPGETLALYGRPGTRPDFILRCDKNTRQVGLARAVPDARQRSITIRTEMLSRSLSAAPVEGRGLVAASVSTNDPLLDAMAISRWGIAVEADGLAPLYLPAWAEVARVVEDCR